MPPSFCGGFLFRIMNKNIKKLTTGAVLLAIIGVLMLIDMWTSYLFTDIVILLIPVVIIMYSCMYKVTDGLILSFGIVVIGILCGSVYSYAYMPLCILVGIGYAIGVKRNLDRRTLLILTIIVFIIGEVLLSYVIFPMLGLMNPAEEVGTMMSQFTDVLNQSAKMSGAQFSMDEYMASIGGSLQPLFTIVYVISTILLGVLDGVLTHLLSMILLKRFKIKDLGRISLYDMKPNIIFTYIAMALVFGAFLSGKIADEKIKYLLLALGVVGAMFLMYYGFIFMILWGNLVMNRRGLTIVLSIVLMFFAPFGLVLIGFLYGSGPLRKLLERRVTQA